MPTSNTHMSSLTIMGSSNDGMFIYGWDATGNGRDRRGRVPKKETRVVGGGASARRKKGTPCGWRV
jgi:hypothetical protein